jgi:hypothetical protein
VLRPVTDGEHDPPMSVVERRDGQVVAAGRTARRIAAGVLLVTLGVVALSLATRAWVASYAVGDAALPALLAMKLFDVNTEQNFPTWFASSLLLVCAALAMVIAVLQRAAGQRHVTAWTGLGLALAALSLDEAVAMHEQLQGPARRAIGDAGGGLLHFAWVVPGLLIAAVLAFGLTVFAARQHARVRRLLIVAGVVFAAGALGSETLSGLVLSRDGDRFLYVIVTAFEETLELAGAVFLLWAELLCLRLLRDGNGGLSLRLSDLGTGT